MLRPVSPGIALILMSLFFMACTKKEPVEYLEFRVVDDATGIPFDNVTVFYEYQTGASMWGPSTFDTVHVHIPSGVFHGRSPLPAYGDCIGEVRMLRNDRFHPLELYSFYCKSRAKVLEFRTKPYIPLTLRIRSARHLPDLSIFVSRGPCPQYEEPDIYCERFVGRDDILLADAMSMDTTLRVRALRGEQLHITLDRMKGHKYPQTWSLDSSQADSLYLELDYGG